MANQCLHSDDFDPSNFTIIGGPYSTPDGCVDNFCVCSGVDCGSSGIDPVTCNCTPSGDYDPPSGINDPPYLPCETLDGGGSVTIDGYAYYFDNESTVTVAGESLTSPCWGGHWCNRAEFLPQLQFSDGSTLDANKNINLDNGTSGGDVSDTFTFTLSGDSNVITSGTDMTLICKEANNNCHFDITWIVLTMTDAVSSTTKILFNDCVVPGTLDGIDLQCPPDFCPPSTFNLSTTSGDFTFGTYSDTNDYSGNIVWNPGYPSALGSYGSDWLFYHLTEYVEYFIFPDWYRRQRSILQVILCSGQAYDVTYDAVASGDLAYGPDSAAGNVVGTIIYNEYCYKEDFDAGTYTYGDCAGIPDYFYNSQPFGGGTWS